MGAHGVDTGSRLERGFKLVSKDSIYRVKSVIYCNCWHLTVI